MGEWKRRDTKKEIGRNRRKIFRRDTSGGKRKDEGWREKGMKGGRDRLKEEIQKTKD